MIKPLDSQPHQLLVKMMRFLKDQLDYHHKYDSLMMVSSEYHEVPLFKSIVSNIIFEFQPIISLFFVFFNGFRFPSRNHDTIFITKKLF